MQLVGGWTNSLPIWHWDSWDNPTIWLYNIKGVGSTTNQKTSSRVEFLRLTPVDWSEWHATAKALYDRLLEVDLGTGDVDGWVVGNGGLVANYKEFIEPKYKDFLSKVGWVDFPKYIQLVIWAANYYWWSLGLIHLIYDDSYLGGETSKIFWIFTPKFWDMMTWSMTSVFFRWVGEKTTN